MTLEQFGQLIGVLALGLLCILWGHYKQKAKDEEAAAWRFESRLFNRRKARKAKTYRASSKK